MSATILIVDDEQATIDLLTTTLRGHGYDVLVARNGMDALHQARRWLPDLIVLDLMLDDFDGLGLHDILRRQPSTALTPVLILSALAEELAAANRPEAGTVEFLAKPVRREELLRRVAGGLLAGQARLDALLEAAPERNESEENYCGRPAA